MVFSCQETNVTEALIKHNTPMFEYKAFDMQQLVA
jgi:hypothetical protein